ncbi:MAG: 50S ribosomal protein L25 [Clostridiales bacterium]|nr:50S ribosomal protein L25 [Clostridiales bacterium]
MATPMIKAELRDSVNRKNAGKLRNEGYVPGVIYSQGKETKSIKIDKIELQRFLSRHGSTGAIDVELEGTTVPVLIKETQKDAIKGDVLHLDMQQLSADTKIKLRVPVVIQGREIAETVDTVLQQQLMEIELQCLPMYIPQSVQVDVSELKFGENITIGDLDIAKDENIEILSDLGDVIASLTAAHVEEEEEDAETEDADLDVPTVAETEEASSEE